MIDEELYQQAADELNSDRRRAHIWARACALASDDHDEARYLYTNLRVEELIAERAAGGSSMPQKHSQAEAHDPTLTLESLQMDEDDSFSHADSGASGLNREDFIAESVSTPLDIDRGEAPNDFLQLLPEDDESDEPAASSEPSGFEPAHKRPAGEQATPGASEKDSESITDAFEIDEFSVDDNALEEEFDKFSADNKLLEDDFDRFSADSTSLEDDFLDSYAEQQENIKAAVREETAENYISNLDPDDADQSVTRPPSKTLLDNLDPNSDGTTELDLNLEELARTNDADKHAVPSIHGKLIDEEQPFDANEQIRHDDELSWQLEDAPSSMPDTRQEERFTTEEQEDDRLAQVLERQADKLLGQRNDVTEHTNLLNHTQEVAFAAHKQTHRGIEETGLPDQVDKLPCNLPVDLTLGRRGKEYAIYMRDEKCQAVSTGVSWSALFFTLPFLVYRHLFGTAIIYAILWVIALGGLLLSGLEWMDAGSAASILTKLSTIGFALLALIGLLYLPFRYGNTWRGEKLERRDFELVAWVRASNSAKAVRKARRAAALD